MYLAPLIMIPMSDFPKKNLVPVLANLLSFAVPHCSAGPSQVARGDRKLRVL